ncbi:hypothetical protein [Arenivirga flava]|uniref:Uncharacterized protein n=1 Tax=Arenivirga flava TaxID=1930060 RepID=A0AA37XBQ0_9MICO|nr:hypothetical protein [Arenivirga flava]GMA28605.1 hypothetical protein GCM10025874_18580 [Arenivirga flava]
MSVRTSNRAARLAVPTAAAVVLLLAGCAGADGGGGRSAEDSPLGEYLSAVWGGDDKSTEELQAESDDQNRVREEFIADCMAEEGFEYIPSLDNGGVVYSSDDEEDPWDPESEEWVSQWGYGTVDWPGRDEQPDEGEMEEWVDPNQDYVESLSPSEQEAYYEALNGPQPSEEDIAAMEEGTYEYDWTTSGCYGAADNEAMGEDPYQSEEHAPLMEAMDALWAESAEHPDLAELDAAWADCMADGGEPGFAKQPDAQNSIMEEQNAVWEGAEPAEGEEWVEPDFTELGEREIELALVDLDCREKTDYRDRQLDVQFALEEQFIEDHKAELDAFIASYENRR